MAAGDVLLMHRPITAANFRRDPFGTAMCALIHLTTRSRYNHAALALSDTEMIEATSRGVVVSPIASADEITVIPYPYCVKDDERDCVGWYFGNDLEDTLAAAASMVGTRYGFLNAFVCGFRNMWPGLQIKQDKAMICSELV